MKNFGKKFSLLIILISFFLFLYILYRSQITYDGLNNYYYNKYYFIFLITFVLGVINYKVKTEISNISTLTVIAILAAFYVFELTVYFNQTSTELKTQQLKKKNELMKKKDPNYDTRTRLEVYLDEKKKNLEVAVLPVPISLASRNNKNLLPFSGHSKIRTVFCNELGFYVIYKSDRYGFRNPDKEWDKKEIEYLLVGDSLGHGMCVNENDTISGWLRENLKDKDNKGILNLSMWGNGPLIMYSTLREYLQLNKVKNILWLHSQGNDFTDISFEQKSEILNLYLNDESFTQNLHKRQNEINDLVKKLISERQIEGPEPDMFEKKFNFESLIQIIKLTRTRKLTLDKKFFDKNKIQPLLENLDLYKKILIQANELSENHGSKFYFVDIPDYWARKNPEQANLLWKEKVIATKEIEGFLKKNNISYINIYDSVFKEHDDALSLFPFRDFGHFNQEGYRLTATSIFQEIR